MIPKRLGDLLPMTLKDKVKINKPLPHKIENRMRKNLWPLSQPISKIIVIPPVKANDLFCKGVILIKTLKHNIIERIG